MYIFLYLTKKRFRCDGQHDINEIYLVSSFTHQPFSFHIRPSIGRGFILGGAATALRSIETQPFDWMICLVS